jgi:hypothetical protein
MKTWGKESILNDQTIHFANAKYFIWIRRTNRVTRICIVWRACTCVTIMKGSRVLSIIRLL